MTKTCPHCDATVHSTSQPSVGEMERIARTIYEIEPHYESGEHVDGFQVSPGGNLSWEQAKARDAEFGDDPIIGNITEFAYRCAAALAATPAAGGEQFHPGKCMPDCMMSDGGECCPGYVALYDAYWHLIRGRDAALAAAPAVSHLENAKALLDEWMGMFDPAPNIDIHQFEILQHGIATALMSKDEIADASYPDRNFAAVAPAGFTECTCPKCAFVWQKSIPAAPAIGGDDDLTEILRTALPKYVSSKARDIAAEAMQDFNDEHYSSHALYALARWFDAALAAQPASPLRPYPELLELRGSLKAMLSLFDDEGNMTATFVEMQNAINEGYEILSKSRPSYKVSSPASPLRGREWRHKVRGSVVAEVARGHAQCSTRPICEMAPVVIYTHDGEWWVRHVEEFDDGRFEVLSSAPPEQPAAAPVTSEPIREDNYMSNDLDREPIKKETKA